MCLKKHLKFKSIIKAPPRNILNGSKNSILFGPEASLFFTGAKAASTEEEDLFMRIPKHSNDTYL